jgi:hypothetical protein
MARPKAKKDPAPKHHGFRVRTRSAISPAADCSRCITFIPHLATASPVSAITGIYQRVVNTGLTTFRDKWDLR